MKKKLIIAALAVAAACLLTAPVKAADKKDGYADGKTHFYLGVGTGYLAGSVDGEVSDDSKLNSRHPTFLDLSFDYGLTSYLGLGARLAGTVESGLTSFITPRLSLFYEASDFLFAFRIGPTFVPDPFEYGMETDLSAAYFFVKNFGLELSFSPVFLFGGQDLSGSGYIIPVQVSFGLKGSI